LYISLLHLDINHIVEDNWERLVQSGLVLPTESSDDGKYVHFIIYNLLFDFYCNSLKYYSKQNRSPRDHQVSADVADRLYAALSKSVSRCLVKQNLISYQFYYRKENTLSRVGMKLFIAFLLSYSSNLFY
jgi:hypothetical protein